MGEHSSQDGSNFADSTPFRLPWALDRLVTVPSIAGYEFTSQIHNRQQTIARDIQHLNALLSQHAPPANQGPVSTMIRRGLRNLHRTAVRLRATSLESAPAPEADVAGPKLEGLEVSRWLSYYAPLEAIERQVALVNEVLQQRCSLLEVPDWHLPIEFVQDKSEIHQFYSAIDSVVFSFMERIFGAHWIQSQEDEGSSWLPLAFIGRQYCVHRFDDDPGSASFHVAEIPHADLFRSRMWPLLAHEVGHLLIDTLNRLGHRDRLDNATAARWQATKCALDELKNVINEEVIGKIALLRDDLSWITDAYHGVAEAWGIEFVCDCIGMWCAGPAFFLSHLAVIGPDTPPGGIDKLEMPDVSRMKSNWDDLQIRTNLRQHHPPNAVRHQILADQIRGEASPTEVMFGVPPRVVEKTRYALTELIGTELHADVILAQAENRAKKHGLDLALWTACRDIWLAAAPGIRVAAWSVTKSLLSGSSSPFSVAEFVAAGRTGESAASLMDGEPLSPVEVLNAAWCKRLCYHLRDFQQPTPLWEALHNPTRTVGGLLGRNVFDLNRHLHLNWSKLQARGSIKG